MSSIELGSKSLIFHRIETRSSRSALRKYPVEATNNPVVEGKMKTIAIGGCWKNRDAVELESMKERRGNHSVR